jgi:uncharacterized protein with ParB-like and HNH nuclease domain
MIGRALLFSGVACQLWRCEGSKQFLVPHFQRPYSWRDPQWKALWRDLLELVEDADSKPHFLGSIVTAPARSIPEGVEKRLLIDGQQRLTTLMLLLVPVRDRARQLGSSAGSTSWQAAKRRSWHA